MRKFLLLWLLFFASNEVDAAFCAAPGTDGSPTITGVVNTYFEPTASVSAGATSVSLGTSFGAGDPIAAGDLLLFIQMQDALINTASTIAYGDGASGSGYTSLNSTGLYEFASVASVAGASVTLN